MPSAPDTISVELSVAEFTETLIALHQYMPEDEKSERLGEQALQTFFGIRDDHMQVYGAQQMLDKALEQYDAVEA